MDQVRITGKAKDEFVAAVVSDCLANLTEGDKETFRKYPDPSDHHFGYGMYIRNHYQLWSQRFSETEPWVNPDDLPQEIVELVIERVLGEEKWNKPNGFSGHICSERMNMYVLRVMHLFKNRTRPVPLVGVRWMDQNMIRLLSMRQKYCPSSLMIRRSVCNDIYGTLS